MLPGCGFKTLMFAVCSCDQLLLFSKYLAFWKRWQNKLQKHIHHQTKVIPNHFGSKPNVITPALISAPKAACAQEWNSHLNQWPWTAALFWMETFKLAWKTASSWGWLDESVSDQHQRMLQHITAAAAREASLSTIYYLDRWLLAGLVIEWASWWVCGQVSGWFSVWLG